jgi:hypothetical protein
MPSVAGVGVRRRKAANFLAELGGAEIESPHHGEAPSGVARHRRKSYPVGRPFARCSLPGCSSP